MMPIVPASVVARCIKGFIGIDDGYSSTMDAGREFAHGARIADIAARAKVGTATVDRVLHGRGGVSSSTIRRVNEALDTLKSKRDSKVKLYPRDRLQFHVILPANAGPSTSHLGRECLRFGHASHADVRLEFAEKMNPAALAEKLDQVLAKGRHGIAFQALDHPRVRDVVARISSRGVSMVCLMSGIDGLGPEQYMGMDNRAAGRTAGFLMGRMAEVPGKIAVVGAGDLYRCHEERETGFRGMIRSEFPQSKLMDLRSGRDDAAGNYRLIKSLLKSESGIVGIYNVGGGNLGIARALENVQLSGEMTFIGHNLTARTRKYLIDGVMDAVVHQDMTLAARMAIASLVSQSSSESINLNRLPIEIITKENLGNHVADESG